MGTHQVPPDSIPNAGLTEELDRRIGTAAAHAVSNVPMAKPDENVGSVLDGMRGSTFAGAVVVAVCTNGRLVGLAPVERLLAAPADAVLGDVTWTATRLLRPRPWRSADFPWGSGLAASPAVKRSPACSSAAFSRRRCCRSSAGCGTTPRSLPLCRNGPGGQHHCHSGRHGAAVVAEPPRPRRVRAAGYCYPRPAVHRDLPCRSHCIAVTSPIRPNSKELIGSSR